MHLVYLGIMGRLLQYLLSSSTKIKVRLSGTLKKELNRRTEKIYSDVPDEYPRKMRPIYDLQNYKSAELNFFLRDAAPVVPKKLVSDEIYEHFMLLTVACRFLCSKDAVSHIKETRELLKTFVESAPGLYGTNFVSLNVHNLIHMCDDIESTGCTLNELSAFAFESYLGMLSSVLRSPTHVIAQLGRRVYEIPKIYTSHHRSSARTGNYNSSKRKKLLN